MSSRSRRSRAESLSPALFPFLAVLVCTMGALVLILVIVVSQASASAKQTLEVEENAILEQSDMVEVASEELKAQRKKQQEAINNRRAQLAGIEDHIHRLVDELKKINETKQAIEQQSSITDQQRAAKTQRMLELQEQIQSTQEELAEAQAKAEERTKPAFAILPYQGKHGTTRRPIYIECTQGGVIIQPEGVMISIEDLKPPHGPGNPLDASLRLIRSNFQRLDPSAAAMVSPYPLLLVRPDGIKSYVLARAAMNGWDDQFGYELIDQNMPLAFPPSVPGLSKQLVETIEVARQRQTALIAAMPRRYNRDDNWDDALDSIDQDLGDHRSGSTSGSKGHSGKDWSAIDREIVDEADASPWKMVSELPNGPGSHSIGSLTGTSSGSDAPSIQSDRPSVPSRNVNRLSNQEVRSMQQASRDGQLESQGTMPGNASSASIDAWSDPATRKPSNSETETLPSGSANATGLQTSQATPLKPFSTQGGSPSFSSQANQNQQEISQSAVPSSEQNPREQSTNIDITPRRPGQRSSTDSKKPASAPVRTWTTTHRHVNGTMVTRPMTIVAMSDRWLIMRDNAPHQVERSISLDVGPSAAGQQLESAINERVESWGIAVSNGYWQPKLSIQVAPDAQLSVQRLRRILDGSGLENELQPLR
jgi:Skp family chaperone for outer membrane proteins